MYLAIFEKRKNELSRWFVGSLVRSRRFAPAFAKNAFAKNALANA